MEKFIASEVTKPKFGVGDVIASHLVMGTILYAFFDEDGWNYCIGDNATIEPERDAEGKTLGHKIGPKFIREREVCWLYNAFTRTWREVEKK